MKGTLGCRQTRLLTLASQSSMSFVMPIGYADLRAVEGLQARGLLVPADGWPGVWRMPSSLLPSAASCSVPS